mmetsp:Transcript_44141/g.94639  ORF Transcript_44141/g.94639 Transcript_44141/m.94639 type:complete len:388 (-) Transcript_44141:139-1302(-)
MVSLFDRGTEDGGPAVFRLLHLLEVLAGLSQPSAYTGAEQSCDDRRLRRTLSRSGSAPERCCCRCARRILVAATIAQALSNFGHLEPGFGLLPAQEDGVYLLALCLGRILQDDGADSSAATRMQGEEEATAAAGGGGEGGGGGAAKATTRWKKNSLGNSLWKWEREWEPRQENREEAGANGTYASKDASSSGTATVGKAGGAPAMSVAAPAKAPPAAAASPLLPPPPPPPTESRPPESPRKTPTATKSRPPASAPATSHASASSSSSSSSAAAASPASAPLGKRRASTSGGKVRRAAGVAAAAAEALSLSCLESAPMRRHPAESAVTRTASGVGLVGFFSLTDSDEEPADDTIVGEEEATLEQCFDPATAELLRRLRPPPRREKTET